MAIVYSMIWNVGEVGRLNTEGSPEFTQKLHVSLSCKPRGAIKSCLKKKKMSGSYNMENGLGVDPP